MSYCYKEKKQCVDWIQTYFSDCLCNFTDQLSFGFGFISILAWFVAEIPQITTNFKTKSSQGISIYFLITWVIGDVFNLAGCYLEPATLPTQYYTAVLYTLTTSLLLLQTVYYDHFYTWWKGRDEEIKVIQQEEEEKAPLNPKNARGEGERGIPIPIPTTTTTTTTAIEIPRPQTASKEFYYASARSLAGSNTPPSRSYMREAKSGHSSTVAPPGHQYSSEDDNKNENELNAPVVRSLPRPIPRVNYYPETGFIKQTEICLSLQVAQGAVVIAGFSTIGQSNAMVLGRKGFTGIRLLQEGGEYRGLGQILGWFMALVYMGGRIPQIALNIKRGSVEGLSPLMFIFALVGNITYVASILLRNSEWKVVKANLPWLLDAVACVMLDLFIIMQYVYYQHLQKKDFDGNEGEGKQDYYVEVNSKA